ncbi:FKBP-type peptidyl-prolyl cis-trans isomerase [Nisaea acidiphila]|uniref:Peptidyl-prolyl cis-trans isomerase n=1 Tax=Nisaea acidiphila TaxID=1862145 RepID=A0A9J7APV6_9PROT|nr:FKBP-type peptidyl-prolyl cis-trans isomerase [Nisaea acidiphila]UUX49432.1 FKBP-type peptidyl-prolyl cis-trans isomerase [Nisaea acidiphila]
MSNQLRAALAALILVLAPATGEAHHQPGHLTVTDLTVGTGATAAENASVTVHYTGWLMDGTKFDSSLDRNTPFTFTLGAGRVIRGWDQGVEGMKVGGKRELIIPADLAYGERGAGGGLIPPNATLKFEVELISVAAPKFRTIGNADLKSLMDRGVTVIDIRRPDEWEQTGTIPGAKRLTAFDGRGQFVQSFPGALEKLVTRDQEVVLICRTGSRSLALARAMADQAGYTRVYNHGSGILDWVKDGNPVEK